MMTNYKISGVILVLTFFNSTVLGRHFDLGMTGVAVIGKSSGLQVSFSWLKSSGVSCISESCGMPVFTILSLSSETLIDEPQTVGQSAGSEFSPTPWRLQDDVGGFQYETWESNNELIDLWDEGVELQDESLRYGDEVEIVEDGLPFNVLFLQGEHVGSIMDNCDRLQDNTELSQDGLQLE